MAALTLAVFVQTVEGREAALALTRSQIELSDVGSDYTVLMGEPGKTAREHLLAVLDAMASSGADLVLRLEDDVDVAPHVRHNLTTWPELHDARFGAGWAFAPGGVRTIHDYWYQRPGESKWVGGPLAYSQAVLLWRRDVDATGRGCVEWFAKHPGRASQDLAIVAAVYGLNKQVCIHAPPQVEHRIEHGSTLAHPHNRLSGTTCGEFVMFRDWRRAA